MGCPVGPLRNLAVGTFGGPWHIQKARPMLSAGTPPLAGQPAPRPRAPGPGGPFVTAATSAARGPPASHRTQSTPPPAPGTASGRNEKGNLINSFRIQHFPHSIIFKLNNLSLREKGQRPLSSALPAAQSRHCGPDGERVSAEPAPQCPLSYARSQAAPAPAPLGGDPGPRPHGLCGALVGSRGPGWGRWEAGSERKGRQKRLSRRGSEGPCEGGGDGAQRRP